MMTEKILLFIFAILLFNYVIFLVTILIGLNKLTKVNSHKIFEEFVSVIIPFRNETENILKCLESLTAQNYPSDKYEVIFVDDSSTDDSYKKISEAVKPANFKAISVPLHSITRAFKKRAVSFGIENAKGEIIVTTDADCIHNPQWLEKLISSFDHSTGFVSGPVSFSTTQDIFSKIQAIEFAGLIMAGAGLIGIKRPTICNGANLAFRKSLFKDLKGYSDQMNLSSGEDELLMQKIANETKYLVKFCWQKQAVVQTEPNKDFSSFFQQRKRWASKGLFYKNKNLVLMLLMIYLFYLSIPVQLILGIIVSKFYLISFLLSIVIKLLIEHMIISKGKEFIFERTILKYFLITEIFQIIYIILIGLFGTFSNIRWKERVLDR